MRVRIPNGLLRAFTRRAKARFPREYIEMLYGREVKDGFEITAVVEPEQTANTTGVVWIEDADADTLDDTPRSPVLLGTIHSHPREADAAPSEFDWKRQVQSGDLITGICALWGEPLRSKVRFYEAQALLTIERG